MNCPHCFGRDVGRIAQDHYYCWDCCVEFERRRSGWQVFSVDDDGQLVPLDDLVPYSAACPAAALPSAGRQHGEAAAAGGG